MPGISAILFVQISGTAKPAPAGNTSNSSATGTMQTTPDKAPIAVHSTLSPPQSNPPQSEDPKQSPGPRLQGIGTDQASFPSQEKSKAGEKDTAYTLDLSQAERQVLQELKARDREVKAHEQAHIAAGGRYVQGGANYSYRIGPDGKMYAVGGEVSIDVSPVPGDPQSTIEKAEAIQRAARAPAQPSAQDASVAAQAASMEMQARMEVQLDERQADGVQGTGSDALGGAAVRFADNQSSENGSGSIPADQAEIGFRNRSTSKAQSSGFPDRISALQGLHAYARMAAPNPSSPAGRLIQASI